MPLLMRGLFVLSQKGGQDFQISEVLPLPENIEKIQHFSNISLEQLHSIGRCQIQHIVPEVLRRW